MSTLFIRAQVYCPKEKKKIEDYECLGKKCGYAKKEECEMYNLK